MHRTDKLRNPAPRGRGFAALALPLLGVALGCEGPYEPPEPRRPTAELELVEPVRPPPRPAPLDQLRYEPVDPLVDVSYRGLDVVDDRVVWVGGQNGAVLVSVDGGDRFLRRFVSGARDLDFRDVQAFDHRHALVMSAGPGDDSRVYRTSDQGLSWEWVLANPDETGFFDGMAFWSQREGLVYGDPVDGRFFVARTEDGGSSWSRMDKMPEARDGEAGFAASGTGIAVQGLQNAWFCTGGVGPVRVFRSVDGGWSWTAHDTPLEVTAASAGGFSLCFADAQRGVLVGGDYLQPFGAQNHCAITTDGGETWTAAEVPGPAGHRACVAVRPGTEGLQYLCVGRAGVDASLDGGRTWTAVEVPGSYCVDFGGPNFAFFAGADGKLGRLTLPR